MPAEDWSTPETYPGDVHFKCVGCGKCCDSPPQLSIREMYALVDDFVLEASLLTKPIRLPGAVRAKVGNLHARVGQMGIDRAVALGGLKTVATTGSFAGSEVVTTLSAIVRGYPHKARCPALQADNSCGVYARRPSTCRYLPAQHLFARDEQGLAIGIFNSQHKQHCDWSPSAPTVLRDGVLVDEEMVEAFSMAEADERADGELLGLLLDRDDLMGNDEFELLIADLIEQSIEETEVTIPVAVFTLWLEVLKKEGELPSHYDIPTPEEVARRQQAVCQRMIDVNLREKDRAARPHTEMLRLHLRLNEQIIRDM
ncbi:hypothetical protein HFN89_01260 [Rhizobium laguerreae]|nr:hypothetical protein [Rhizobium laguerreae]